MNHHQLKLKVHQGTRSGKRLCDTCRSGQIMRTDAESGEIIYCHSLDMYITQRIIECSNYDDKTTVSLGEMRSIAWQLSTDKNRNIGFISPRKWRALRRDDGLDDLD
jgi:hypothetical protein